MDEERAFLGIIKDFLQRNNFQPLMVGEREAIVSSIHFFFGSFHTILVEFSGILWSIWKRRHHINRGTYGKGLKIPV